RCRLERLGAEPPGAGHPLVATAARGARPVAHGGDVLVALRYRSGRGPPRRASRRRLLRGTNLWAPGGQLRAHRPSGRERQALLRARPPEPLARADRPRAHRTAPPEREGRDAG